jgi:hypothetical protein
MASVVVHNHLLGAGFYRRLEVNYVAQAVRIVERVLDRRKSCGEEDAQHDFYRYHNHNRVRVAPARRIFYYQQVRIQIVNTPFQDLTGRTELECNPRRGALRLGLATGNLSRKALSRASA